MQKAFDWDEIKAQLGSARFGEEMLQAEQKENFFSDSAQAQFKQVEANVTVEGEDPICKEYSCWRMTPKADEQPRIVFASSNGAFAVLKPETMTRKQMRNALCEQLGLTDRQHQTVLVHKAENIAAFYARNEQHAVTYTFRKHDFNMQDPLVALGLRKTDEEGNTIYTKKLPISSMHSEVNRTEKDFFRVDSTVTATETDAAGVDHTQQDKRELVLSFSDKKSSLQQLRELYVSQGVPAHVAKQMAKDVFKKAEMQNPEKPIQIQEVREQSMTIAMGTQSADISTADKQAAADRVADEFGISAEVAETIVEKAEEIKTDAIQEREEIVASEDTATAAKHTEQSADALRSRNGHELHPEGNALANAEVPDLPSAPELPPPSMGARR